MAASRVNAQAFCFIVSSVLSYLRKAPDAKQRPSSCIVALQSTFTFSVFRKVVGGVNYEMRSWQSLSSGLWGSQIFDSSFTAFLSVCSRYREAATDKSVPPDLESLMRNLVWSHQ
jgi:hypothetical protein